MPAAQAANTVASIYDGDTLTLNNGAKVRLLQIDTPELSSGECYGQEAKQAFLRVQRSLHYMMVAS